MAEYNDTGGVILDGPFDPDAQATVTDFIDYTEYLPADLIRSLTLIRGLDKRYLDSAHGVHELTKIYGQLPDLPPEARPDPCTQRKEISDQLDNAINARESAYAEACRMYDVIDRHFNRLGSIREKLEALPKPAERDPTPPSQPTTNAKRPRTSKKGDNVPQTTTRITLRLDGARSGQNQKSRTRRSLVAAEHLSGLHPDSPIASTEHSDNEGEAKTTSQSKKDKRNRRSRPSGSGESINGTRASAGISTSSALAMLKPPPEDARPGSEDLPWLRLTEWEMTKLRKKMKKNAVWQPSEVMIHRELALRGRGWEAYRAAKLEAEANGEEFVDCDDIMKNYIPGLLTRRSEATKEFEGVAEPKLSNRGMKLNEAKKLKRENQAREQAALAAAEAEAAKRLGQLGSSQGFISNGADRPQDSSAMADRPGRSTKKRKLEASRPSAEPVAPPEDVESRPTRSSKRRKTENEPLSTEAALKADSPEPQKPPTAIRTSVTRSKGRATPTPIESRPPSRRLSIPTAGAISNMGRELRRKSLTPARKTPIPEGSRAASVSAPPRRRKRPAPGPVSNGQDGGAAVSYGRRKAKPGKKRTEAREQGLNVGQDIRIDEDGVLEEIDPNEPRYCLCGDVSFGTMICCENHDCDREWFHLECVGLSEVPGRTAKWYCPECRVKLNKGTGVTRTFSRR
ncbi:putative PHD finger domain protein [Aspergillus lucknowensis]|uniref:Chromatin modification-related protein n=1 Tax=Aspergillus lucknowensis TaxID=176173 RepID=A0ABR4LRB4_9EURO